MQSARHQSLGIMGLAATLTCHRRYQWMQAQESTQLSQVKQLYTAKDTEMRYWKVGTCQIKGTKQAAWQVSSIHPLISRATDLPRPWCDSNFIISSFLSFSLTLNELLLQTRSLYIFRTSSEVGSRNCWWLSVFRRESLSANNRVTEVREADMGQNPGLHAAAYDVTAQYAKIHTGRIRMGKIPMPLAAEILKPVWHQDNNVL